MLPSASEKSDHGKDNVDEKTGQPSGFDVDAMNWIARKMGFTVTHKPMAWDGIIPALNASEIDMICSGMSITEERAKAVQFSRPYWEQKSILAFNVVPRKLLP